jgi:hypothetical protein
LTEVTEKQVAPEASSAAGLEALLGLDAATLERQKAAMANFATLKAIGVIKGVDDEELARMTDSAKSTKAAVRSLAAPARPRKTFWSRIRDQFPIKAP